MGLKKIEIKKIISKQSLKVTYTKRRTGLFRKADGFCSKTGAQIAIITFSPGQKPFTFGNPSVDSVIDRYEQSLNGEEMLAIDEDGGLHDEVGTSSDHDEEEEMLQGMTLDELKQYARSIEEQKNKLAWQIEDKMRRESSTIDLLGLNASAGFKLSGVKEGEKMEMKEMERRESRTKDFLRNFN